MKFVKPKSISNQSLLATNKAGQTAPTPPTAQRRYASKAVRTYQSTPMTTVLIVILALLGLPTVCEAGWTRDAGEPPGDVLVPQGTTYSYVLPTLYKDGTATLTNIKVHNNYYSVQDYFGLNYINVGM